MKYTKYITFLAIGLYIASLTLPAVIASDGKYPDQWPGYALLLGGWLYVLHGQFAWCANSLALAAFIFERTKMYKHATLVAVLAFVLGLQALMLIGDHMPSEGGQGELVIGMGIGYYFWLVSFALLGVSAYLQYLHYQSKSPSR